MPYPTRNGESSAKGRNALFLMSRSATLQKRKEFSVLWAVIGFLLCLLPFLIYLMVYASKPDFEVLEITVMS